MRSALGIQSSPVVTFDFCGPPVAHDRFQGMARDLAYDVGAREQHALQGRQR